MKRFFDNGLKVSVFALVSFGVAHECSSKQMELPGAYVEFRIQGQCDLYEYTGSESGLESDFASFWQAHSVCGKDYGDIEVVQNTSENTIYWDWENGGDAIVSYEEKPCAPGFSLIQGICINDDLDPDKEPKKCDQVGNPIYFGVESKVQFETDTASEYNGLSISRVYRSNLVAEGHMGKRWFDNHASVRLSYETNGDNSIVTLFRPNSYQIQFYQDGDAWVTPSSGFIKLLGGPSAGWSLQTESGTTERYDSFGKLVSISQSTGHEVVYEYQNDLLDKVVDNRGASLTYFYNENLLIEKIKSTSFGDFEYTYLQGTLSEVRLNGVLIKKYLYDNQGKYLLSGMLDADNHQYASWEYDNLGRPISSYHGDQKEKVTVVYFADSVEVTGPLEKKTIYHLELINGTRNVVFVEGLASENCSAANRVKEYFGNGSLKSKTDWKGNVTTYVRDQFGRETSRTEAAGTAQEKVIATEYHPTWNRPSKITEPGLITEMEYDSNGRLMNTKKTSITGK